MKHKGQTPAIYASSKRVYLIQPGQSIPALAKFIISHANIVALAWAFDKSTFGNRDGTRTPSLGGLHSYAENAEAVLQRVVSSKIEEVSLEEFQTLRHTLGSSSLSASQPDLGWRNYYYDCSYYPDVVIIDLLSRGLMEKSGDDCYRVTARGMVLAGAPQIDGVESWSS